MRFNSFNGSELLMMLVGSANLLAERRSEIDSLNVLKIRQEREGKSYGASNMKIKLNIFKKTKRYNSGGVFFWERDFGNPPRNGWIRPT